MCKHYRYVKYSLSPAPGSVAGAHAPKVLPQLMLAIDKDVTINTPLAGMRLRELRAISMYYDATYDCFCVMKEVFAAQTHELSCSGSGPSRSDVSTTVSHG